MRITLVPWIALTEHPRDGSPLDPPVLVPDAGGGTMIFGRYATFDLRPYDLQDAILITPDYNRRLLQEGGKRLDLGQYLDRVLLTTEANEIGARLGVNVIAGMTVGDALRLLIEPGLVPDKDGNKHAWLHHVDLMDDSTAAGG